MRVLLTSSAFGLGYELTPVNKQLARRMEKETGNESVLFQTDWDFPSLAESLGWNIRTAHKRGCVGQIDGTVTCVHCGRTAGHFIAAAQEWLDKRVDSVIQAQVEDYFPVL
jgi:hypothetical protein